MLKYVLSFSLAIALSGCASEAPTKLPPPSKPFAVELGLSAADIVYEYPARFATVPAKAERGDFQFGLYVQTTDAVRLFSFDPVAKSFHLETTLSLANLKSVAVGEFGATKSAKQLQLFTAATVVAVTLYNNSTAATGTSETTQPAYDGLIAAHVPAGQPVDRIVPADKGATVYFVPMR